MEVKEQDDPLPPEPEVKKKPRLKLRDLITVIITILIVLGGGELTGTVDVGTDTECPEEKACPLESSCMPVVSCPEYSIAYVNNCRTGATDKYICNEKGKCKSTQEILSELG